MRLLLVNPGMNLARLGRYASLMEPMPCIGLAYVAASVQARGHLVRVVDVFAEALSPDATLERVRRFRPDVVGFSVMTPAAPACASLSRRVRQELPQARLLWGGIHADLFAGEILSQGLADVVVHGDGELTAAHLLDTWGQGATDLSEVPGISWRKADGTVVSNPKRPLNRDLDALPWPAWELFPVHRYGLLPFADLARPVLTVSASRGCPHRCDYCSLVHGDGGVLRRRDPVRVVDEIHHLHQRFGVRQVGFVDPIFPLGAESFARFASEMIRRGLPDRLSWLSETRADGLEADLCRDMYAAGCRRLLLGIEAGSPALLGSVHKTSSPDRAAAGVRAARQAGIQTVGLFMLGLPGETPDQTRQTVEYALSLDLDFAKFAITVPFPGSKVFEDAWQKTLFRDDWDSYTTFNPDPDHLVWHPEGYDPRELVRMQRHALLRFYLRPSMIRRQLLEIRTLGISDIFRGLYGSLR